jgi:hypothetical protein
MISSDIIHDVNNMLFNYEKMQLRVTCKTINDHIKNSIIYEFNEDYSMAYVYSDCFKNIVESRLKTTLINIILVRCNIDKAGILNKINGATLLYCNINDIPKNNLVKLNLMGTHIPNITNLTNIKHLDLSYTRLTDVSILANVYELNLSNTYVSDVSNLKCHKLNLNHTCIKNVNNLIHTKILFICHTWIDDVSNLKQLDVLDASLTNIKNVSMLINLRALNVSCTPIDSTDEFMNLKKLIALNISFTRICNVDRLNELKYLKYVSMYNLCVTNKYLDDDNIKNFFI